MPIMLWIIVVYILDSVSKDKLSKKIQTLITVQVAHLSFFYEVVRNTMTNR